MKNKTAKAHFRQGDVGIFPIVSLPSRAKKLKRVDGRVILAYGEVTGHHHSIVDEHVDLFETADEAGVTFLEVKRAVADLTHQEHATIPLPEGLYKVVIQREYQPKALPRRVAD